ncbi:MAG: methyltransferase domain-containing protein [Thermoplasmata archaeon]|nr:MAG: methyltransferase domain-containing protein [Thermoplasmata archaeon]
MMIKFNEDYEEMVTYWYENYWEPGFKQWWKGHETLALHVGLYEKGIKNLRDALLNMNDFVGKLLKLKKNEKVKVLDAGCGVGGTSIYLGNKYPKAKFIGITISRKQVEWAKKYAKERNFNKNTEFLRRSYLDTGFQDESFDKIFALESVDYAPDKRKFVKEMNRILKKGGRLVVVGPAMRKTQLNPFMKKICRLFNIGRGNPFSFLTLNDFKRYLEEEGFTNIKLIDISKKTYRSSVNSTIIGIPFFIIVFFKKLLKGKKYDYSKDPHFYLAVDVLAPILGLSGVAGYYAITADKR